MQIIFLDIDGVLNDVIFDQENPGKYFREECMQVLATIVKETDAKIVLSSTWKQIRDVSKEESLEAFLMWQALIDKLSEYDLQIFDITPDIKGNRPLECLTWIKNQKESVSWISIEDDFYPKDYAEYKCEKHLLQTEYFVRKGEKGGLRPAHIPVAMRMFEEQRKEW